MHSAVDLLGLSGNADFEGCLRTYKAAMGEQLLFSDFVWKTNKRGRKQKRAFVITSQAIYNFLPGKYTAPKRRILFNEIDKVHTVWGSKLEFVIYSKTDWTYTLACARRQELIDTLALTYSQLMSKRLLIIDENEGDLTLKLTHTQAAAKIAHTPAAKLQADSDDEDDPDDDMRPLEDSIIGDAAIAAEATDPGLVDEIDRPSSSVLTDAAYVVAQFRERLTAVRSGSFVAVGNQYLDDEVHYKGKTKPFAVLYRAMRDALPQLEDLEQEDALDAKWGTEDDEVQFESTYHPKVREVLNNWPHQNAIECCEAVAELLLNPEINSFVLARVYSSKELFMVVKMICATLLRHISEQVRRWALKCLWKVCNYEETAARGHLAETFVELVIPFTMGIKLSEGVYQAFLELLTGEIAFPSGKDQQEVDLFGKNIQNHEILPLLIELVEHAELPLRHRLLKDMNLFLLNKRTNVEVFFEFPGWHAWIFPLIAEVPRELPNRSEMQDEMFKYAVHVYSIIFTEVFVSKTLQSRLQTRSSLGAGRAISHPVRTALLEMMEALDGWSGWGTDTVNFARAILVATINKVKTRTNAQIWKHDFEKPEWMSLLALMFVVRDFMFFYPVVDDDLTYEEPTGTSKADRESRRVLPRQHDNDQLLRRAHEEHKARSFVPDEASLGLHLDPRHGVMEDLGLAKKALELLDSLNLKHEDMAGNSVLDDPTVSKVGKDTYKRAISLRQGMYECVKLFEDLHAGNEAKEEVLFKVCKHLGEAGHISESETMGGNVGTFLLDVVRNAVGSKTKTLKMARRLKQSMEQHSTKRSVRLQQNVLADIAAALGPTSREAQRLAPADAAIPEEEEVLSARPTVVTKDDLIMKVARVGQTTQKVDDILQANLDGLDRTAAQRRKLAEIAPAQDANSQLEAMVLAETVEVGIIECCHCGSQIHGGVREAVCAIGGYWHVHCFNCTECGCELTKDEAGRFFEYNQKPYCAKDFLKQFAPHLCGGCFKPFHEGDELVESCGRKWHIEHFLCRECGCCLRDRGAFKLMEEEQYCVDCFELYVARCPACRGPVGDDAIIAFKRAWHTGCFACVDCALPLLNTEFFGGDLHDGKGRLPYCRQHFVDKFMPKCMHCHNPVEGGVIACGGPWHMECLCCQRCGKNFDNNQFYERRGQPVCEGCYQEQFEGACALCCEPLGGSIVEVAEDQFYHTHCFVCTTCQAPFPDGQYFLGTDRRPYCATHFEETFCEVCAGCGLFITDGNAATVADKPWHRHCVQCRECRRNLLNEEIFLDETDGSLLCREHFSRSASKPCNRCKTKIAAEMITVGQLNFHPECFLCDVCGTNLQNQKVFQEGGLFLCETDFRKRVSQVCKACQLPLTDKFSKIAGSTYHPDCVKCTRCQISLRKPAVKKPAGTAGGEAEAKPTGGMFSYKNQLYCGSCIQEAKSSA